jgi:hypothetical protein
MYNLLSVTTLVRNDPGAESPTVRCATSSWRCRLCGRERSIIVELWQLQLRDNICHYVKAKVWSVIVELWQPQLIDNIQSLCQGQGPERRREKVLQKSSAPHHWRCQPPKPHSAGCVVVVDEPHPPKPPLDNHNDLRPDEAYAAVSTI